MCQLFLCQNKHLCILFKTKLLNLFALKHSYKRHFPSFLSTFLPSFFSLFFWKLEVSWNNICYFWMCCRRSVPDGVSHVTECHALIVHRTKSSWKNLSQIQLWVFKVSSTAVKGWLHPCKQMSMNFDSCHHLNSITCWAFFFLSVCGTQTRKARILPIKLLKFRILYYDNNMKDFSFYPKKCSGGNWVHSDQAGGPRVSSVGISTRIFPWLLRGSAPPGKVEDGHWKVH